MDTQVNDVLFKIKKNNIITSIKLPIESGNQGCGSIYKK